MSALALDSLDQPLLALAQACDLLGDQAEIVHSNGPEGLLGTEITPLARLTDTLAAALAIIGYCAGLGIFDPQALEAATVAYAEQISERIGPTRK